MNLPRIDAAFFMAATKVQETLNRVPLPATEYQASIGALRGMIEHAESLTLEVEKLRAEVAAAKSKPTSTE